MKITILIKNRVIWDFESLKNVFAITQQKSGEIQMKYKSS